MATLSITGTDILSLSLATAVWKPHVKHCNHFEPRMLWKCREYKWQPLFCMFLGCDCRCLGIVNACCMLTVTDVRWKGVNGYLKHFWKPPHIVPCRGFHIIWNSFTSLTWQTLSRLYVWRRSEGWHDRWLQEYGECTRVRVPCLVGCHTSSEQNGALSWSNIQYLALDSLGSFRWITRCWLVSMAIALLLLLTHNTTRNKCVYDVP